MIECLISFVFLLMVALLGYGVVAIVDRSSSTDRAERLALCFPAGVAAYGALLYTLNILGAPFNRGLVLGIVGCGALVGMAAVGARCHPRAWRARVAGRLPRLSLPGIVALIVALILVAGQAAALLTQVNHLLDTGLYHFPNSGYVFHSHQQPHYASQSMGEEFSFPPAMFEVYAALWVLLGRIEQLVPNVLPLLLLVSWVALSLLAARRILDASDDAAAFALLLFAGLYELPELIGGENTDLLPAVLGSAAVYLVARDLKNRTSSRLALAGVFLGLCCWTKYQGVPFTACLVAAIAIVGLNASGKSIRGALVDSRSKVMRFGKCLVLIPFVMLVPFLIRNWRVFGSPIYPGGCGIFPGCHDSAWALSVVAPLWQPQPFWRFPDILFQAVREPAVLLGVPATLIAWIRRDRALAVAGITAVLYLCVLMMLMNTGFPNQMRFGGPGLAVFCWMGGALLVRLEDDARFRLPSIAFWGVCTVIIEMWAAPQDRGIWASDRLPVEIARAWWSGPFIVILIVLCHRKCLSRCPGVLRYWGALAIGAVALFQQQPVLDPSNIVKSIEEAGWSNVPSDLNAVNWMQGHASDHSVTYSYYLQRWAIPGALLPGDDPKLEWIHQPGVKFSDALEALREMGVDYVLVCRTVSAVGYRVFDTDPIIQRLSDRRYFELLQQDETASLYRVHYPGGAHPLRPDRSHPMPWLMDFGTCGPMPG